MQTDYYYLDGKDQKGPLTVEQLKTVGLKPDTLVWADSFDSWKQAKDVPELSSLLKKLPPPPPIVDNIPSTSTVTDHPKKQKTIVEDSNVKSWVTFKIFFSVFVLFGLVALTSYLIVNSKKENLRKEIDGKINSVFDGKTVVLDGEEFGVQGELEETNYGGKKKKPNKQWVTMGKDSFLLDLNSTLETWKERDKLYTVFNCTSGGFTIKKLTKLSDESFDLETYYSNDMGYREPAYHYVAPQYYDSPWGGREMISGGYQSSNYRPSVKKCYSGAFDFFTKDDKTGAYTSGKFVDITNFPDLRNEYFYMDNIAPKKYFNTTHFSSEWRSTDDHSANVYTDQYRVYYSLTGRHYELITNDKKIMTYFLTISGIGTGALILLLIVLLASKPKFFRNLFLFGKRWKNNSYEEQILFFEHSFFRSHKFTEIINDSVSKGILKITDKGNTINLSYPNKELFYKIEKLDLDNLTIVSLKDGSSISFTRIGAKPKPQINVEEVKETKSEIISENTNEKTN